MTTPDEALAAIEWCVDVLLPALLMLGALRFVAQRKNDLVIGVIAEIVDLAISVMVILKIYAGMMGLFPVGSKIVDWGSTPSMLLSVGIGVGSSRGTTWLSRRLARSNED